MVRPGGYFNLLRATKVRQMTCRLLRRTSEPQVLHLHRRAGSVRVVEIGPLDRPECPNCATSVRLLTAPDHNGNSGEPIYQCDDCLGMVSFHRRAERTAPAQQTASMTAMEPPLLDNSAPAELQTMG